MSSERWIARFSGRRVVVLGDLVADEFVYGDIERVSREAPVLILQHRRTVTVPGGGANAVANLQALGAHPVPLGLLGRDASGNALAEQFRQAGVPTEALLSPQGWETPTKSRVLAGGVHTRRQQVVRVDRGATHGTLSPELQAALAVRLQAALAEAEALVVADYGYGAATPEIVAGASAGFAGPVLVDSRARVAAYRGVLACTPNQEEVERVLGRALADEAAVLAAGPELLAATGNRAALVTRGALGMVLFQRDETPLVLPAHGSDEVADVTGAGDTVIATFALAVAAGAPLPHAARLANVAAGLVVMKAGTATVSPEELRRALQEVPA
ncbi:MAG TPA: PfkB family carbohydrate kinase [Candidatus Polarisedimenticolaceae bacterium]|nr:PfkB family carbohydrate kinase [Candidatus Polarisedimenticolaceae bacterium]